MRTIRILDYRIYIQKSTDQRIINSPIHVYGSTANLMEFEIFGKKDGL